MSPFNDARPLGWREIAEMCETHPRDPRRTPSTVFFLTSTAKIPQNSVELNAILCRAAYEQVTNA